MGSESTQTVDNVEIRLSSGGHYALDSFEPGQSKSGRINPVGKGTLQASYFNLAQSKELTTPQMYVDRSGGFRSKLTIGKSGTAQWSYDKNFLWP